MYVISIHLCIYELNECLHYNEVSSLFTHDSCYSHIRFCYSHIAFLVIHKLLTEHYPHHDHQGAVLFTKAGLFIFLSTNDWHKMVTFVFVHIPSVGYFFSIFPVFTLDLWGNNYCLWVSQSASQSVSQSVWATCPEIL